MNKYQLEVKEKGNLPKNAFPGGYPIYYVTKNNEIRCASKEPKNIENHSIHWEGTNWICEECNEEIESAYGELEEK